MNLNFETDGVNFNNKGKPDEIATSQHICDDMSNLFDYADCNKKIWADIYCKTGNTLASLRKHGVPKENIIAICDNKQSQMLICRKLYGKLYEEIDCSTELNTITRRGQVYYVEKYSDIVKNRLDKHIADIFKTIKEQYMLEFKSEDNFKINNIIMNPPYNPNDLYIDFVTLAHKIASDSIVAITPAKWQAKGGEKNEAFRNNIVPYMSKIVSYPCTKDVFDKVAEAGGISSYLVDKQNHDDKYIRISCSMQPLFNSNGFEHSNRADMLLNKICASIVDKCNKTKSQFGKTLSFHQSYYIQNTDSGNKNKLYKDDVEVFGGKAGGEVDDNGNKFFFLGYKPYKELKRTDGIDKYKVCISCMTGGTSSFGLFNMDGTAIGLTPASVIGPNQVNKGSYYCLKTFDSLDEAKSLQSYLNCRLIRFLVRCSVVGTTLTEEFFRFVPDPGKFDHIFTDEELYQKYGLTDEEIAIIESVIKERK